MFNGLYLIDQAIGDVTATSAVLDEIVAYTSGDDAKHEAIDNLFRASMGDLAEVDYRAQTFSCSRCGVRPPAWLKPQRHQAAVDRLSGRHP